MARRRTRVLEGEEELMRNLSRIVRKQPQVAARALKKRGDAVMARSQELVPDDPRTQGKDLKASGKTNDAVIGPSKVSVTMHYGANSRAGAYVIPVHEYPAKRPAPWQGASVSFSRGGPKFLERAVLEEAPRLLQELAKDLNVDRWAR